ncbi:hypothetical protein B0J12DRAFT_565022 [Macrophomina phaseolina]|uniref:N-acetylglucosamine-6-phosphate deacetylase n=1 Tax=Macrophomina phaseolina TaxID=35725 RepID=A0ABQ8GRH3_9PEZI|nr:hypothetical protein B0J12DRAFT_565022 [Macrophomina phaseolina]
MSDNQFTLFTNGSYCLGGELVDDHLVISEETGRILKRTGYIGGEIVDLEGNIVAPGFLELHTNGVNGFHFTHFESEPQYGQKLKETAEYYVSQGVTGFWATIPTVDTQAFHQILPSLRPRSLSPNGAYLHGAHAEGPYLHPSKAGAHNPALFHTPSTTPSTTPSPLTIYGARGLPSIKLTTLAPELPSTASLITTLTTAHSIRVSLGHTTATYAQALSALTSGATCLTHTLNAMPELSSRSPGPAGLLSLPPTHSPPPPYYTLIPDGHHLHPRTVALLHRAAPTRAILVTDSIELAGPTIPAGIYPGHAQIPHRQRKETHDPGEGGANDTLIGGCGTLAQGVRNLMAWSGCSLPEAVRAVTENVAHFMGVGAPDALEGGGVGVLKEGNRADLVVLSEEGEVLQTWVGGRMVWEREGGL